MKHYVIVNDWANEYESGTNVLGVVHSLEEAKKIFNESLADEKQYAEERSIGRAGGRRENQLSDRRRVKQPAF